MKQDIVHLHSETLPHRGYCGRATGNTSRSRSFVTCVDCHAALAADEAAAQQVRS